MSGGTRPSRKPLTLLSAMLKTSQAAPLIGISQGHLKRQMDNKGGPLRHGHHYFLGPTKNSPILWDVEAVRAEFDRLGMLHRKGEQLLNEIHNAS